MAVAQYRNFAHRDTLPATWTDAVEQFLTALGNFSVRQASATVVEVYADATHPAGLMIAGKPRWTEATVNRTVVGGAGVYDLYAVAAANEFAAGAPAVGEIDNTYYGFELRLVATGGAAPAGNLANGKAIAHTQLIRRVTWSGTAITRLDPVAGNTSAGRAADGTVGSPGLSFDLDIDTGFYRPAPDVVGVTTGGVERGRWSSAGLSLDRASAGERLYFGSAADASLYRAAAGILKTDGSLQVVGSAYFGSLGDTNLYRAAVATLRTDGAMVATGGYSIGLPLTGAPAYQSQQVAAQTVLRNKLIATDTVDTFHVLGDGKMEWGGGGSTGPDTNLYRAAADSLKTDDTFNALSITSNNSVYAAVTAAGQVRIGAAGPSSEAAIVFGLAADTNLYRSAADTLKTDDTFRSTQGIFAGDGSAGAVGIGAVGPSAAAGVVFGSSFDTNLYRSAADTLRTDDSLLVGGGVRGSVGGTNEVYIGGLAGGAGIAFSATADTTLYRTAADRLRTDDGLQIVSGNSAISPLAVSGTAPAAAAGAGTNAAGIVVSGAKGGDTTVGGGLTAGGGASINLTGGAGGDAAAGSTAGAGGDIVLTPGNPGGGAGVAGVAGAVRLASAFTRLGFYGGGPILRPAAYALNAGAVSRNLPSGATAAQIEQVLRQLLTDFQASGLVG